MDALSWSGPEPRRQPRLRLLPPPPALPRLSEVDHPDDGDTVGDPLVITGRLPHRGRLRLPWLRRRLPCLLIDAVPAAHLADAVVDGERFALLVAMRGFEEGLHTLALGRGAGPEETWSCRTVRVRRGTGEAAVVARDRGLVAVRKLGDRPRAVEVRVGGEPWGCRDWFCGRNGDGWLGIAELDLADLPPGAYPLEIRPAGHPAFAYRLLRLPR